MTFLCSWLKKIPKYEWIFTSVVLRNHEQMHFYASLALLVLLNWCLELLKNVVTPSGYMVCLFQKWVSVMLPIQITLQSYFRLLFTLTWSNLMLLLGAVAWLTPLLLVVLGCLYQLSPEYEWMYISTTRSSANGHLLSGMVPRSLKHAVVQPCINKAGSHIFLEL